MEVMDNWLPPILNIYELFLDKSNLLICLISKFFGVFILFGILLFDNTKSISRFSLLLSCNSCVT